MIKLLHIEDDADIREIAKLSLELTGEFEVVQCASGVEALALICDCNPDVILLDMMMPDLNGKETLRQMRSLLDISAIPVVFMTARAQASEMADLRAFGAADVIPKPFDPMSLGGKIKMAMGLGLP